MLSRLLFNKITTMTSFTSMTPFRNTRALRSIVHSSSNNSNSFIHASSFSLYTRHPHNNKAVAAHSWIHSPLDSHMNRRHSIIPSASDMSLSSSPPAKRMILTDAMALLYRSHFAFSPDHRLRNSHGQDTTVVFGFLSTLLSLLELPDRPSHIAVVFDASGKTFRHELFQGYKGHRPETPQEVREAVPLLRELLPAMGVAELCVPGVEADDVIGTLAVRGVDEGFAVAIASPDKDFFQLLRQGLILLRPPSKKTSAPDKYSKYSLITYTEHDFTRDWNGLTPSQFVDALALMGDASDNVPGVSGIGPKTATNLLLEYKTLDGILENAQNVKPKRAAEALISETGIAAARLSRQLVEIRINLDIPPTLQPLDQFRVMQPPIDGGERAMMMLRQLELKTIEARLKNMWQQKRKNSGGYYNNNTR